MRNIYERLTPASAECIRELEADGWKFTDEYWESYHNGTPYYDVGFKSPTMEKTVTISETDWPTITKAELLRREVDIVSCAWVNRTFRMEHITTPIIRKLSSYLLKSKSVEYVDFKVSPSITVKIPTENKCKLSKVKITIEIT